MLKLWALLIYLVITPPCLQSGLGLGLGRRHALRLLGARWQPPRRLLSLNPTSRSGTEASDASRQENERIWRRGVSPSSENPLEEEPDMQNSENGKGWRSDVLAEIYYNMRGPPPRKTLFVVPCLVIIFLCLCFLTLIVSDPTPIEELE